jgi:hypothetical protein
VFNQIRAEIIRSKQSKANLAKHKGTKRTIFYYRSSARMHNFSFFAVFFTKMHKFSFFPGFARNATLNPNPKP